MDILCEMRHENNVDMVTVVDADYHYDDLRNVPATFFVNDI